MNIWTWILFALGGGLVTDSSGGRDAMPSGAMSSIIKAEERCWRTMMPRRRKLRSIPGEKSPNQGFCISGVFNFHPHP